MIIAALKEKILPLDSLLLEKSLNSLYLHCQLPLRNQVGCMQVVLDKVALVW